MPLAKQKPYRCTKRYMTLIESLISLFLLSFLLLVVFGFFREISLFNESSKQTAREGFKNRYVESRLASIFSHLVNENDRSRKFYFYTIQDEASPSPGLAFTFYNQAALDPHISGDVVGRLFLDFKNRFCLAIWPLLQSKTQTEAELAARQRTECLLEDVRNIRFSFLAAPDTDPALLQNKDGPPKGQWTSKWEKEYNRMPVIVKIEADLEIPQKDRSYKILTREFAFVLPSSKNPVTFVQP